MYNGPEGTVSLTIVDGTVWISARYAKDLHVMENFYAACEVAFELFEVLKEKGVKYVYCTADSVESFKFNEMLGFRTTEHVIHDKHEVMEKEL